MSNRYPWYDSKWLWAYAEVSRYLAEHDADAADAFLARMEVFRTDPGFKVQHLRSVLPKETLDEIRSLSKSLSPSELELHEAQSFGRWVVHDHPRLTELQHGLTERVSGLCGEEVEPCYNFLSMYTQLGRCPVHMDTPQAKYTLDICLDQSGPWDIHLSRVVPWPVDGVEGDDWSTRILEHPGLEFRSYALAPGEAILFSGSSQWHYRDPMPDTSHGAFCDLLFFHYIPKGTAELVFPGHWPELFAVPALAGLPPVAYHRRHPFR